MLALFRRPFKEDRLALPLSTPPPQDDLSTSDLPRSKPLVGVALPASLSARSFPFTPACPGQYTHRSFNSKRKKKERDLVIVNQINAGLVSRAAHGKPECLVFHV